MRVRQCKSERESGRERERVREREWTISGIQSCIGSTSVSRVLEQTLFQQPFDDLTPNIVELIHTLGALVPQGPHKPSISPFWYTTKKREAPIVKNISKAALPLGGVRGFRWFGFSNVT